MKRSIRRELKRHLKSINFDLWKKNYGETGEYRAMQWLRAYIEGRTCAEPIELVKSILRGSINIDAKEKSYLSTLLRWC